MHVFCLTDSGVASELTVSCLNAIGYKVMTLYQRYSHSRETHSDLYGFDFI